MLPHLSVIVVMSFCLYAHGLIKLPCLGGRIKLDNKRLAYLHSQQERSEGTYRPKAVFVLGGKLNTNNFCASYLKANKVYLFAGPGSGKGTQCEKLAQEFGLVHLSAGELLRQEMSKPSANGKLIDDYLKKGQIVPVQISLSLLKEAMRARPCSRYLIDGFPRNKDNLQGWEAEMKNVCDLDLVLFIDCNHKELERRILERGNISGRSDDNLATALKRFRTFEKETMPIIEHFAKQPNSLVVHVDGAKSVDTVYASVRQILAERVKTDKLQA